MKKGKAIALAALSVLTIGCQSTYQHARKEGAVVHEHAQSCEGQSLQNCTYELMTDFFVQDDFKGRWKASYVRRPHFSLRAMEFFPFKDIEAKGRDRIVVLFEERDAQNDCARNVCDRTMTLYFDDREKLPIDEVASHFHLRKVKIDEYEYFSDVTRKCWQIVFSSENGFVRSIGIFRYRSLISDHGNTCG